MLLSEQTKTSWNDKLVLIYIFSLIFSLVMEKHVLKMLDFTVVIHPVTFWALSSLFRHEDVYWITQGVGKMPLKPQNGVDLTLHVIPGREESVGSTARGIHQALGSKAEVGRTKKAALK